MDKSKPSPDMQFLEEARLLTRWTRRYAQSRTLPVLVTLPIILSAFIALGFLSKNAGWAYFSGRFTMFWCSLAGMIALCAFFVWISVPQWGYLWLERLGWRYYKREGNITVPCVLPRDLMKKVGLFVGALYGAAIVTHLCLGFAGYASTEHMQPVSALYVVPFIVFIALSTRTYIMLLFPLLYGLHAILLLSGVPLRFCNDPGQDFLITLVCYMLFTALVGHAYNRYALARMKREARTPDAGEAE